MKNKDIIALKGINNELSNPPKKIVVQRNKMENESIRFVFLE